MQMREQRDGCEGLCCERPAAVEVIRETLDLLAYWLGSIIDLLEPEVIVIGGVFRRCSHLF